MIINAIKKNSLPSELLLFAFSLFSFNSPNRTEWDQKRVQDGVTSKNRARVHGGSCGFCITKMWVYNSSTTFKFILRAQSMYDERCHAGNG